MLFDQKIESLLQFCLNNTCRCSCS